MMPEWGERKTNTMACNSVTKSILIYHFFFFLDFLNAGPIL